MKAYALVLTCCFFAAAAAFSIPDQVRDINRTDDKLELLESEACRCTNGRCVTNSQGKKKCKCNKGYSLQDEFTCQPCDCGKRGTCIFTIELKSEGQFIYKKKCLCDQGSAERDGKCIDCHCGEHSKCEFEDDEKMCYCIDRYSEKEGVCTECDCGDNGECKFERGQKMCTCDEGYLEHDGYCKECDCGEFGVCTLGKNGEKECSCYEGFSENDGNCEKCWCGDHSLGCSFKDGEVVCTCKDNMAQLEEQCVDCKCGNASDGCTYENEEKHCNCKSGYVQKEDTCEIACGAYRPCQNGGQCKRGICSCPPGTSGDFCQIIDQCDKLCPNIPDVTCTYDIDNERAYCKCKHEMMSFDPDTKECRRKCEKSTDCMNGGKCTKGGFSLFCRCLDGTKGDLCEKVPGCNAKDCGENAICVYDIEKRIAVCKCEDASYSFDPIEYRCKKRCQDSSDCENGGTCYGNDNFYRFCRCPEGTEGDLCEKVIGCESRFCGYEAKCAYDSSSKSGICMCNNKDLSFDPTDKKCKRDCKSGESKCYNGGHCTSREEYDSHFCECLLGTSGDLCEIVDECDRDHERCRDGSKCSYDIATKKTFCECPKMNQKYDVLDKKCKQTCDYDSFFCQNGGKCAKHGYDKFCECLDGTEGDFCETIRGCDVKNCGEDAKCGYEFDKRIAVCMCNDESHSFDPVDNRCKKTCQDNSSCENFGTCSDGHNSSGPFCRCPEGTSGDFCEHFITCEAASCGHHAECFYSIRRDFVFCLCKNLTLSFDRVDKKCKKDCGDWRKCHNGGYCNSRKNHSNHFCECLSGTSGDLCESVDGCQKYPDRCKDGSTCSFDIARREVFCECPNRNDKYDILDQKCKLTCDRDDDCKHGGRCVHRGDHPFCNCKKGTSGASCQVVDDCEKGVCGHQNDVTCGFDSVTETVSCGCKDPNSLYDPELKICKACDCGANSISCLFEKGQKMCTCKEGFEDEDGICKRKYCIKKNCLHGKCEVIDEEEICSCYEGYVLDGDGDFCKKLNCSQTPCINGTCIVRHGNKEQCVCPAGYSLNRDTCMRGFCRIDTCYGGKCMTIDGELMCVCPDRFHLEGVGCYETVCVKRNCFGGKCVVEDDQEICTCPDNHILVNDVCKKIICEKKNCFGGQCHIVNGSEECTCPVGFSLFEDVCREDPRSR